MLITRIELENIKSYRHLSIDLRRGTSAISGANGSGKTTLVEAIGFALFDYLPYNQGQFVREGEKYGIVVIHLIGSDDRPYEVERRCGAGAKWVVYDREADARIEQRADVQDKLHEIFGIDRERPLENLFRDALGVPQGTFTSIFLETPSKRKPTFDALLQIEDYKIAADYLLDVQKQYREQMQTQQSEIQRLTFETRDLETWREDLKGKRLLDQQQKQQNEQWRRQLTEHEELEMLLTKQFEQLRQLEDNYKHCKTVHENAQQRLQDRESDLTAARNAQQAIEASSSDYLRYQQADELLKQLRSAEQQRNTLTKQRGTLQNSFATIQTTITHLHDRLEEVAAARQYILDLLPQVEQQHQLDKRREALTLQVMQYKSLQQECKRLAQQQADCLRQQDLHQKRIAKIEPLQPLAALLTERVETLARLHARIHERGPKQKQLEEKRKQLQEKRDEHTLTSERLHKADNIIAKIEDHRHEAEELPGLQEQQRDLSAQLNRLEGNIEGYKKSRKQSIGGQCPLLHEACINIKQRGLMSLESYFDNLLTEDQARIEDINQQLQAVNDRIAYVKKYADALDKLSQYKEQRENLYERTQRVELDIRRLEEEITGLEQDLQSFKLIDQEIARAKAVREESEKADLQVRELEGLHKQVQQLQGQAQQYASDLVERQQQAHELSDSEEQLRQVERELQALNDPYSRSKAKQEVLKQEGAYQQRLQAEQRKQQETERKLQEIDQQLLTHADLDVRIGEQETLRQQSSQGYQTYLKNEHTAKLLPEREQAYQKALSVAHAAEQARNAAEQAYNQAKAGFNQQNLDEVRNKVKQLREALNTLAGEMSRLQRDINKLEQDISQAEAYLVELDAAQKEYQTLEELHTMTEQFRKLIKEAAPHVLKAMLADISAEANRIFGEIMGDRSGLLSWQNDYEIVLCRQGVNRTFAQLSGGEQMSAALAVRLALLKKLSTLNIAFFDEPTQNMDELRRMNLAEQIRRVRGFDQLIVISHDDTFEQGLDSLVRLRKVDGETRCLSEDDTPLLEGEQRPIYAS